MRTIPLLIIQVTIFICGCGSGDYHLDENSFKAKSLDMLQQRTGINLPDGSRGLHMFYRGSTTDPAFIAKIEIPASGKERLADQIKQFPRADGDIDTSLPNKVSWWNPSDDTIEVERLFEKDMNPVHAILCNENNRSVLYVMWIKI